MAIPYSRYIIGSLPWYSVLMVSGIFIAYLLGTREEKRLALPKDSMLDMVLVAVPSGIIGARLYYVLMSLDQFMQNPISVLFIWQGGIAVYGSIIGGTIGVWLYCRIKKRSFATLLDIAAPGLALAQAIGRWGNYFNREAFGPMITAPVWQFFPAGVLIEEGGAQVWHVATFFYESMWDLSVFLVLWLIRKRVQKHGDLFLWYMALYGSGRFLVEQLRTDSLYLYGIRASQYVGLLTCAVVAVVFLLRLFRSRKGLVTLGALCACSLSFVRLLIPENTVGIELMLTLYLAGGVILWLNKDSPLYARILLIADAMVYLALLMTGQSMLWHSPYFIYTGLSIPLYLAIPYIQIVGQPITQPQPQPKEA